MRAHQRILREGVTLLCLFGIQAIVPRVCAQAADDPLKQHFEAAQDLIRKGDQDRAAVEYKAFLGEAIHRVANARARAGDVEQASQNFEEAMAFAGSHPALLLDYASVLLDGGRLPEAEKTIRALVDAHSDNAKAQVLLGRIYFEQKNYASAKAAFTAAGAASLREIWRPLAISYLQTQDLVRARALLQNVIVLLGDSPENRVAIATTYYYGDYPDEAVIELKKALAQSASAPAAHYYLGLAYLSRNEEAGYLKAIPEFQGEISRHPGDFSSHYMLGYIFLKQRNFAAAEQELKRAAKLNPADTGTRLLLAEVYIDTHRPLEAEKTLRELVASSTEGSPGNILIRGHYMLGRLLEEGGKLEEGAAEINKAEQLRKQLRLSAAEVLTARVSKPAAAVSKEIDGTSSGASAQQKSQAQAFIAHLSPAIAEGYYSLAAIASQHHNSLIAAQYLSKAKAWDPTIATGGQ